MRDHLIGYLLDALDSEQHDMVKAQLSRDPQLKHELELISRCLEPLRADKGHFDPPAGLAHRTCEFVAIQAQTTIAPPPAAFLPNRWTLADLVVAAGIFFAATMLFFPALNQSRFAARLLGCQNNLRQIGMGLTNYSALHNDYFPDVPTTGRLAAAGIYAPKLVENRFLDDPQVFVCPASMLAEHPGDFRLISAAELQSADEAQVQKLHEQMGGSYGYNIGHVANGHYQPTRNLRRAKFALMADAPTSKAPYYSLNHERCGQNVLFEDGHVQYLTTCKAHGCNDHFYVNDDGKVEAGLHPNDAVVAPSSSFPKLIPAINRGPAVER